MRFIVLLSLVGVCWNGTLAQVASSSESQRLEFDVRYLSQDSLEGRETGTIGELIAAQYISQRFREIGLSPKGAADTSYFQIFSKKTKRHPHDTLFSGPVIVGRNILGFVDNGEENTVVIGAHYDHLGWGAEGSLYQGERKIHNGADDNASGVAALLLLAQRLVEEAMNSNFLFIAFSGEEKGLLGSNYFVNNSTIRLKNLNYMINMDMVGRLDSARRLAVYGVGTSPSFIPAIERITNPEFQFKMDSSGVGPSDHTSFYLKEIPVIHFFTGQHEQYHKPEDDLELINFDGLFDVSDYINNLITVLDSEKKLQFTKTRDKKSTRGGLKVTLGIIPDYLFSGQGLKIDGVKENRPAHKAGIVDGDVVVRMGKFTIQNMNDYMNALKALNKGEVIEVIILRGNVEQAVTVEFD